MAKRRLIDLDEIKPIDFPSIEMDGLDVVRYLNTLPTVDAVEVVLCMECKNYKYRWETDDGKGHGICDHSTQHLLDDSFCSYGERKSDG